MQWGLCPVCGTAKAQTGLRLKHHGRHYFSPCWQAEPTMGAVLKNWNNMSPVQARPKMKGLEWHFMFQPGLKTAYAHLNDFGFVYGGIQ